MTKRLLSVAIAVLMVLSLVPMSVFAKAADGQATKIIIPSEIQSIAGLAEGIVEATK